MPAAGCHHVHAEPSEVLQQRRLGRHIAAALVALLMRIIEIGMGAGFEIGEYRVGGVEHVAHRQIFRLAEHRDRARHHDVAEERNRLPGAVGHRMQPEFFDLLCYLPAALPANNSASRSVTAAGVAESRAIAWASSSPVTACGRNTTDLARPQLVRDSARSVGLPLDPERAALCALIVSEKEERPATALT